MRRIFLAFMRVHILHHAAEEPFFGLWIIDELNSHGYEVSAGTIYPILHRMEEDGLLETREKNVDGKIRKYYHLTERGAEVLAELREKTAELFREIVSVEGEDNCV